jgi:hypothetical protein
MFDCSRSNAERAVGTLRQARGVRSCPEEAEVEVTTGQGLLLLALLLASLLGVMSWHGRGDPRGATDPQTWRIGSATTPVPDWTPSPTGQATPVE